MSNIAKDVVEGDKIRNTEDMWELLGKHPSLLSAAVTNTVAKGNLKRKGFLWLTHLEHSITERRESSNSRKEPGGGN